MRGSLIVRRRDIEGEPRPRGGEFATVARSKFPVPSFVSRSFGIFCADTAELVVALTYDDGPSADGTPAILDVLAAREETATFFVLGQQVERYPGLARRIRAEGHELALHGHDHQSLLTMGDQEAVERIGRAKDAVEQVVSAPLRWYRPPYGEHTARQARGIARLGLDLVIWSVDSRDWASTTENEIVGRVTDGLFPGSIVLLHDHRGDPGVSPTDLKLPIPDRAAVLRQLLDVSRHAGYLTVSISKLLDYRPVRSWARERMVRV